MENTSCGENCPFVKSKVCVDCRDCPNYIESWWIDENGTQKLIKDCSPKRLILQQQLMQSRLEAVQEALEQSRNEYITLSSYLKSLMEASKKIIDYNKNEDVILLNQKRE